MTFQVEELFAEFFEFDGSDRTARSDFLRRSELLIQANEKEIDQSIQTLLNIGLEELNDCSKKFFVETIFSRIAQRFCTDREKNQTKELLTTTRRNIVLLYRGLGNENESRFHLLRILAYMESEDDLKEYAEILVTDPPEGTKAVELVFLPLFQSKKPELVTDYLFPRLLDGILHPQVAGSILDLANYLSRKADSSSHPAAGHQEMLANLLGGLVRRLDRLEEHPEEMKVSLVELQKKVTDCVALTVSLCDCLSLLGGSKSIGKLYQALEVRHRRVRAEAAAALARLGEEIGKKKLIELAAEPVSRLRVLAYSEELGLIDEIEDRYKTPVARAEAEFVNCLAQQTRFGIPPQSTELFDTCTQFWPSYDNPVDCFLFRYIYRLPQGIFENIGIAGPVSHALIADLADLPPADIYAAYAGWQTQHDEIFEIEREQFTENESLLADDLRKKLANEGYRDICPLSLGFFFGTHVLIAEASREKTVGTVLTDGHEISWYPRSGDNPIGKQESYCIYKGRKILRTFNS